VRQPEIRRRPGLVDQLYLPLREVRRRAEAAVREGHADRLVHVVDAPDWEAWADGDTYEPATLDDEGFVHCSTPSQVLAVAEYNHAEDDDPLLLVVDPTRVEAQIKYEEQDRGGYAHVYGPLNEAAIVDVLELPREGDRFVLPAALGS